MCSHVTYSSTTHNTETFMPLEIFYILLHSVIHLHLFIYLDFPAFCLLSLLKTHNTNIHVPGGIFFCSLAVLCLYCFVLIVLHFDFCPYCTTHQNTNTHARGGIQTRNPRKRAIADPRLTPLGHRDRSFQNFRSVIFVYVCWVPTELQRRRIQ